MNTETFLVTTVGGRTVCTICHERETFVVYRKDGRLQDMCAYCYRLNKRAYERWSVSYDCDECGEEPATPSDLRQIHDVLQRVNGRYPVRHVCPACRDKWWAQVQFAIEEELICERAMRLMLALLVVRMASRRGTIMHHCEAA